MQNIYSHPRNLLWRLRQFHEARTRGAVLPTGLNTTFTFQVNKYSANPAPTEQIHVNLKEENALFAQRLTQDDAL